MSFAELGLSESLLRAVANQDYTVPTPIQTQAIPPIIAGKDMLGCAQTGTGKTAAFALPILHRLTASGNPPRGAGRKIRVLVLSPTRELALQISESFHQYGQGTPLKQTVIFGGVSQLRQTRALERGVDILIATPGRLLDLMNQGYVDLKGIQILVLDEADRMLDMGFMPDIRRIMKTVPKERQTLLFSATVPDHIRELADSILNDPVKVKIAPVQATTELIEQSVYFVSQQNKAQLLAHFLSSRKSERTLIFARTKHGADALVKKLARAGLTADAIHGNKSQNARQRVLASFKQNQLQILVATDIAARGIDVDGITSVVNFDLPHEPETYVHRIGRTGRAGAKGIAVSFCGPDERRFLQAIQKEIRRTIPVAQDQPAYAATPAEKSGSPYAGQGTAGQGAGPKSAGQSSSGPLSGSMDRAAKRTGRPPYGKRPAGVGPQKFGAKKKAKASNFAHSSGASSSSGAARTGEQRRSRPAVKKQRPASPAGSN